MVQLHAVAFDNDPEAWERYRLDILKGATPDQITLAEGIVAAERLNDEMLEITGERWEFTKFSDGTSGGPSIKNEADRIISNNAEDD